MRERGASGRLLGEGGAPGKGRPLGATIHVSGIDKTMSASSTYGDYYRCHLPALVCYLSSDQSFSSHIGQMSSLSGPVLTGGEGLQQIDTEMRH